MGGQVAGGVDLGSLGEAKALMVLMALTKKDGVCERYPKE